MARMKRRSVGAPVGRFMLVPVASKVDPTKIGMRIAVPYAYACPPIAAVLGPGKAPPPSGLGQRLASGRPAGKSAWRYVAGSWHARGENRWDYCAAFWIKL